MKFDKVYKKYQEGNATDEEVKYIEKEIEKAKNILEQVDSKEECEMVPVDDEVINNAKKQFDRRMVIKTLVVSVVGAIIVIGMIVGIVFGTAFFSARRNAEFSEVESENLAKQVIATNYEIDANKLVVTEKEKELEMHFKLVASYFSYEYELTDGVGEYTVVVNSKTGETRIIDIEGVREYLGNSKRHRD